jgi:DNA-binding SARP family transcriptional activator
VGGIGKRIGFKVLGPVRFGGEGRPVSGGGVRMRTLLAVLLVKSGETVTKDQFYEELWGTQVPAAAENALQALIARLRRQLREAFGVSYVGARLLTRPGGYQLNIDPEDLDASLFGQLVARSRRLAGVDSVGCLDVLNEALSLWKGRPLQDIQGGPICRGAVLEYEEKWMCAVEEKIRLEIALGNSAQAISELKKLVFLHPWREVFTDLLMVSLYRAGRQAEAIAVYNSARARLVQELGMEPSPLLQERIRAILNQDPTLAVPACLEVTNRWPQSLPLNV